MTCGHKWRPIQNFHACLLKKLVFKSENRHQLTEIDL